MFTMRTTKPEAGNNYYIRKANGGYSPCILGKPTDKDCNVLANCVGYAIGRFNEEINAGKIKYWASMNAENFYENAYKWNLETGQTPKLGAVMCWEGKGSRAGHVAIVEKVISDTEVYTSESAYGGKAFYNSTRKKGANGNWGASSNYSFNGFIYNPEVVVDPPKPTYKYKVGAKVKIIGTGNANSYGTGNKAGGIGWTRYVTKIYEGRPYPYQVGKKGSTASKDTTGFYQEDALKQV